MATPITRYRELKETSGKRQTRIFNTCSMVAHYLRLTVSNTMNRRQEALASAFQNFEVNVFCFHWVIGMWLIILAKLDF